MYQENQIFSKEVLEYLKSIDISKLSINEIIVQLNEEFGIDYESKKDHVEEALVMLHVVEDFNSSGQEDTSNDLILAKKLQNEEYLLTSRLRRTSTKRNTTAIRKGPMKKRAVGPSVFSRPFELSEQLRNIVGKKTCSRHEAVKYIWQYVKQNSLQDPSDKRFIMCDEALKLVFKKQRVNCFGMNRELSRHLYDIEDDFSMVLEQDSVPLSPKLDYNQVSVPQSFVKTGLFSPVMSYHDIQVKIIGLMKSFRSKHDPDMIDKPSTDSYLNTFFKDCESQLPVVTILERVRAQLENGMSQP